MHKFYGFQLGFGIYGPGCASPSRFIEIYKYLPWIESTTTNVETGGSYETRKWSRKEENIPVHQLFRSGKKTEADLKNKIVPYIPEGYETGLAPDIVRIDRNAIILCK